MDNAQVEAVARRASQLIRLQSDWVNMSAKKFNLKYPNFEKDRERIMAEYAFSPEDSHPITLFLFAQYADAIYDAGAAIGPSEYERGFQAAKEHLEARALGFRQEAKRQGERVGPMARAYERAANELATAISNMEPVK